MGGAKGGRSVGLEGNESEARRGQVPVSCGREFSESACGFVTERVEGMDG
jgi:hypothetical protein